MTNAVVAPANARAERPRLPIFYPSHIKLFRECPERYYHKYVARRRVVEPFSRPLAKGIATHEVLADYFAEFRANRSFPINIQQHAEVQLLRAGYPPELATTWDDDVADVVAFVQWALARFDGTATVLGIEETLGYAHNREADPVCPQPFLLRAKVDLVLSHPDGTLEHLDFKSGRAQRDPIQEIASRVVVGSEYGDEYQTVRTTTYFVAEQTAVSEIIDRSTCREAWKTIRETVNAILTNTTWQPEPSPLCQFCPFFGNGCSADPKAGDVDTMSDWLNGGID